MKETYRTVYRIRVQHDYFTDMPPQLLELALTADGRKQMQRDGLLFRQTGPDEWILVHNSCNRIEDKPIELTLSVTDPQSWLYTVWPDKMQKEPNISESEDDRKFNPRKAHTLTLPKIERKFNETTKKEVEVKAEIDVAASIRDVWEEVFVDNKKIRRRRMRRFGEPFCRVMLELDDTLSNRTFPPECILRFQAPALQWEYLFLSDLEVNETKGKVMLRDTTGKIDFVIPETKPPHARWYFRSAVPIPLRATYGYKLRLAVEVEQTDETKGKSEKEVTTLQVLLPQVPFPEPGKYMDAQQGLLRQVCYY